MISKGCLVRTSTHRNDLPFGTVCLVITEPYGSRDKTLPPLVVDVLFEGEARMIDIHNVEEVQ